MGLDNQYMAFIETLVNGGSKLSFTKEKNREKKSIYLQGDDADCMYFVESGMASVRIHNQVSFTT